MIERTGTTSEALFMRCGARGIAARHAKDARGLVLLDVCHGNPLLENRNTSEVSSTIVSF